jgi:predicted transcriptional regulator of viral defense system
VPITDRERTVLDGFAAPEVLGSFHEILAVIEEHLAELDLENLVGYALRYGRDAVIKRLGYTLEQLDVPPSVLTPLRDAPIAATASSTRRVPNRDHPSPPGGSATT